MDERTGMSRRTSWTLIICTALLGLTLPIGAYGAAGTVFNLSDASKTGPDGDARITNNKLGTAVCDVSSAGVTTSNCARVSGGRLLTLDREPPNLFSSTCLTIMQAHDEFDECKIEVPARFVIDSITVSGAHQHGDDMIQCTIHVPQGPSTRPHPVIVPLDWVGSSGQVAFFSGHRSPHLHGTRPGSGFEIDGSCHRAPSASPADVSIDIAGYSY